MTGSHVCHAPSHFMPLNRLFPPPGMLVALLLEFLNPCLYFRSPLPGNLSGVFPKQPMAFHSRSPLPQIVPIPTTPFFP